MKWPWVSRKRHDYEMRFHEEMGAALSRNWNSLFAQQERLLACYLAAVAERDQLRADANAMKGRLASIGELDHRLYGPYFLNGEAMGSKDYFGPCSSQTLSERLYEIHRLLEQSKLLGLPAPSWSDLDRLFDS